MLAPLVAFIRDVPLERKILFHVILLVVMGRISESAVPVVPSEIRPKICFLERTSTLLLIAGAASRAASGGLLSGLVTGTAGRAASGGLLGRLVTGTAGRAASSGLLSGLVTSAAGRAAGRAAGGVSFGGLVTGTAGGCGSGSLRLPVPAKEIR